MKTYAKIGVGILATIGALTIGLNFFAPTMFDCQVVPIRSTQSPSGAFTATIESRTCKDPLRSGTYFELRNTDTRVRSTVRLFDNTSTEYELNWASNRALEISAPDGISAESLPHEMGGVRIRLKR